MNTAQEPPITLGLPLDWPDPPADCEVCDALARQRDHAAKDGDHSRVTDYNVEIRNHHAPARSEATP
ncbi:hypothetical protein OG254_24220 [Streptomyces sp. NBC_01092]|nr:hypothetical protein OG254_24220 [Streptomyces sp. NBC_01092]